jgi:hypothetical protein
MGISGLVSMEVLDDGATYDKGKEVDLAEMKTQGAGKRQLKNNQAATILEYLHSVKEE